MRRCRTTQPAGGARRAGPACLFAPKQEAASCDLVHVTPTSQPRPGRYVERASEDDTHARTHTRTCDACMHARASELTTSAARAGGSLARSLTEDRATRDSPDRACRRRRGRLARRRRTKMSQLVIIAVQLYVTYVRTRHRTVETLRAPCCSFCSAAASGGHDGRSEAATRLRRRTQGASLSTSTLRLLAANGARPHRRSQISRRSGQSCNASSVSWRRGDTPRRTTMRALTLLPPQVNRKAYAEDAQGIIRRQRAAIEKLQADNTSMKRELDAASTARVSGRLLPWAATEFCTGHRRAERLRPAGVAAASRDRARIHAQGEGLYSTTFPG